MDKNRGIILLHTYGSKQGRLNSLQHMTFTLWERPLLISMVQLLWTNAKGEKIWETKCRIHLIHLKELISEKHTIACRVKHIVKAGAGYAESDSDVGQQ